MIPPVGNLLSLAALVEVAEAVAACAVASTTDWVRTTVTS